MLPCLTCAWVIHTTRLNFWWWELHLPRLCSPVLLTPNTIQHSSKGSVTTWRTNYIARKRSYDPLSHKKKIHGACHTPSATPNTFYSFKYDRQEDININLFLLVSLLLLLKKELQEKQRWVGGGFSGPGIITLLRSPPEKFLASSDYKMLSYYP